MGAEPPWGGRSGSGSGDYISGLAYRSTPQLFYKCLYNPARCPRLEKLLYLEFL
jgi:hypothetical protein